MLISAERNMSTMGLGHRAPLRLFSSFRVFGWNRLSRNAIWCHFFVGQPLKWACIQIFAMVWRLNFSQFTLQQTSQHQERWKMAYQCRCSLDWFVISISSYWSFRAHLLRARGTQTYVHEVASNHNFPPHSSFPYLRQTPLRYHSCNVHPDSVLIEAFQAH